MIGILRYIWHKIPLTVLSIPFIVGMMIFMSTSSPCKHIFVGVEDPEVVVNDLPKYNEHINVDGKVEGKPIICIRCYERRYQIIEYRGMTQVHK